VVEESALLRQGLRAVLSGEGFEIVGETPAIAEAPRLAALLRPGVTIVGLETAGHLLADVIASIHQSASGTRVVVLADSPDRGALLRALRAGARGYLGKSETPEGLVRALRGVLRGEAALSRTDASFLVDEVQRSDRRREISSLAPRQDSLTPRQLEILQLLAQGASTADVARRLYLSIETVRWHVKSILRKLGVRSRVEAIAYLEESMSGAAANPE
jgi:DNA-binding NarL/FixJ family response regulator